MSDSKTSTSRQSYLQRFFLDIWYRAPDKRSVFSYLLYPLTVCFQIIAKIRATQLKQQQKSLSKPLIVIGNISVGGAGKTPLVIALAKALKAKGIKCGIISRGHGSHAPAYPYCVGVDSPVSESGDEALLIAQSTRCPVVIDAQRTQALACLLDNYPDIDIVISDDGLQHYRLPRSMEIVVIDGQRGLGNGLCLPSGPLREPLSRLSTVDWLIANGKIESKPLKASLASLSIPLDEIQLKPSAWLHIKSRQQFPISPLPWQDDRAKKLPQVNAIAAIGNPQRFFSTLKSLGLTSHNTAFDDHYGFHENDLSQWKESILLMTEKDAVKCQPLAKDNWWALVVEANIPDALLEKIGQFTLSS